MYFILLADCVKEIDAQRVYGYALYKDGRDTKLSYPLEKFSSDVAGRSFHNGRFIQRMREKAATLSKYSFFFLSLWKLFYDLNKISHCNFHNLGLNFGTFFFLTGVLFNFSFFSVKLEQGTVTSLLEEKGTVKGVQYKTKTGQEMTCCAPLTIVCDGCFSNLRRSLCNPLVK